MSKRSRELYHSYYIYMAQTYFIAVRWHSEMIMPFAYEYTYSACNQTLYTQVFLLQAAHKIALICFKNICDQVA